MGILGTCLATNSKYRGNIIFKPFNLNSIPSCKNREVESSLDNVKKALIEAEDIRKILSETFRSMLDVTGTVVLEHPDLVSSIKSYRISFLIEINKVISSNRNLDLNQVKKSLNLMTLFNFSLFPPFYIENKEEEQKVRQLLHFEIDSIEKLTYERNSICRFLVCINKYKEYLQDLYKLVSRLLDETTEVVWNFFSSSKPDNIINATEEEKLSKKNIGILTENKNHLKKINDDLLKMVKDFDEYILMKYDDPNEFESLEKVANLANMDSSAKNDNLKVIIWNHFPGGKIKHFDQWENSFCYQEDDTEINMSNI